MGKLACSQFADKAAQAIREQQRVANEFERHRPRSIDGIGGRTMALHPFLHWEAGLYFGDGDWDRDPDKVKWYLKRNPAAKVRSTGTRIQVGYEGNRESRIENLESEVQSTRRSRTYFA